MPDVDPTDEKTCPECKNTAQLKEWVFIEEGFDGQMIFQCPYCQEQMSMENME